jgi:hypothetical protein
MARWLWLTVLIGAIAFGAVVACGGGDDDDDDSDDDDNDTTDDDDTGAAPTYPNNHDAGWDCYICHDGDFNGAPGEPHGHAHDAPDDCVGCHAEGDWTNDSDAPPVMNPGQDCQGCHTDQHGKGWGTNDQCIVCHQ